MEESRTRIYVYARPRSLCFCLAKTMASPQPAPGKELAAALGELAKTDPALAEFLHTYQNGKGCGRTRDEYDETQEDIKDHVKRVFYKHLDGKRKNVLTDRGARWPYEGLSKSYSST